MKSVELHGQKFTYLDIKGSMLAMQYRLESTEELVRMYQSPHVVNANLIRRILEEREININDLI